MITWPVGVGLRVDDDRKDVSPTNSRSRLAELIGRMLPLAVDVVGAVVEVPGCAAVLRDQEADARRAGVALAGRGDDDRLVGVVIAGEDRDPADVDAGGRAEVGERNPGRAGGGWS